MSNQTPLATNKRINERLNDCGRIGKIGNGMNNLVIERRRLPRVIEITGIVEELGNWNLGVGKNWNLG